MPLLCPFPPDELPIRPVSPVVNSAANEGPQCVAPLAKDTAPPLRQTNLLDP